MTGATGPRGRDGKNGPQGPVGRNGIELQGPTGPCSIRPWTCRSVSDCLTMKCFADACSASWWYLAHRSGVMEEKHVVFAGLYCLVGQALLRRVLDPRTQAVATVALRFRTTPGYNNTLACTETESPFRHLVVLGRTPFACTLPEFLHSGPVLDVGPWVITPVR